MYITLQAEPPPLRSLQPEPSVSTGYWAWVWNCILATCSACWKKDLTNLQASSPGRSGGRKWKESLQIRLWNFNTCTEKVDAKCWLVEKTLVMTSLPWHVFLKVCLHSRPFPRRADWRRESFERACSHAKILLDSRAR